MVTETNNSSVTTHTPLSYQGSGQRNKQQFSHHTHTTELSRQWSQKQTTVQSPHTHHWAIKAVVTETNNSSVTTHTPLGYQGSGHRNKQQFSHHTHTTELSRQWSQKQTTVQSPHTHHWAIKAVVTETNNSSVTTHTPLSYQGSGQRNKQQFSHHTHTTELSRQWSQKQTTVQSPHTHHWAIKAVVKETNNSSVTTHTPLSYQGSGQRNKQQFSHHTHTTELSRQWSKKQTTVQSPHTHH